MPLKAGAGCPAVTAAAAWWLRRRHLPAAQAQDVPLRNPFSLTAAIRFAMLFAAVLLLGILLPVLAVIALNTVSLYRQALGAANIAYDRTLLASAKSLGEQLVVTGRGNDARRRG